MRAYVGGDFDVINSNHIALLQWAKTTFGEVVVSLNQDEFITRYKGQPPTQTLEERYAIIRAIRYVDFTMTNTGNEDSRPAILSSGANVVVVSNDGFEIERYHNRLGLNQEWLDAYNIHLVIQ